MLGLLVASILGFASEPTCLVTLAEGTVCAQPWSEIRTVLHPTQPAIGYAWSLRKRAKNMKTAADAQLEIGDKAIPVVKWGSELFLTDGHHTLSALDASGHWGVIVKITISCDWSHMNERSFWTAMASSGFAYLFDRPSGNVNALPTKIDPSELPKFIAFNDETLSFSDDPWRSLAGASRKISKAGECGLLHKTCFRAFARNCDNSTGYYWAYYWNDSFLNSSRWETDLTSVTNGTECAAAAAPYSQCTYGAFQAAYTALPSPLPSDSLDSMLEAYDSYLKAAELLVPLSRSSAAGEYTLPDDFLPRTSLPGHVQGMEKIPNKDPKCPAKLDCDFDPSTPSDNEEDMEED